MECVFWSLSMLQVASWPVQGVQETECWLYSRISAKGCIEASAQRIRNYQVAKSNVKSEKLLNAAHRLPLCFMMVYLQSMLNTEFFNRLLNKVAQKLFLLNFCYISGLLKRILLFLLTYLLESVVSMSEITKATLGTISVAQLLYCMAIVTSFFNSLLRNFIYMTFQVSSGTDKVPEKLSVTCGDFSDVFFIAGESGSTKTFSSL